MRPDRRQGMTLLELMVVVAIIGISAAMAVPSFMQMQANQRLQGAAREVANAFHTARARAISTGNNFMVVVSAGVGTDSCGNALPIDPGTGAPAPVVVWDDGPPGPGNNCCLDAGELVTQLRAVQGVNWGVRAAAPPVPAVPEDGGLGNHTTGSSFADQGGIGRRWVRIRPDGMPVGVNAACNAGQLGTGGGGVYLNNPNRDYAVVVSPLGGVKVYGFEQGVGAWSN